MQFGRYASRLFIENRKTTKSRGAGIISAMLATASMLLFAGCGSGGAKSSVTLPTASFSPANLDFGAQKVGTSSSQTITVSNAGSAALSISGVTLGGTNASAFALGTNNCATSLGPGSSCTVSITFNPSTATSLSASLSVSDNAANSPQSVGLSGIGFSLNGVAHGMFMVDPPVDDNSCAQGFPPSCYSQHLVPTFICNGAGTPAGYNCTQAGAGSTEIQGGTFHVPWSMINSSSGTYDFSQVDAWTQPWKDSGKLVGLIFEPASFGSTNKGTPSWYLTPATIASVSQTNGIIQVTTTGSMDFFAGGAASAAGLEIQISGTGTVLDGNTTTTNPGIWTVCDGTTQGCQNPTSTTIYAIGPGGNTSAVTQGSVGNPVYGSACGSGTLPIQWRANFKKAWQAVISQAISHYATNNSIAYLRFGMGIGGQTNPTYGLDHSDSTQVACQQQMTVYGFANPSVSSPWPDPGTSQWTSDVSPTWISYLQSMVQYEQTLNSPHAIIITMSGIQFGPPDLSTPDAIAQSAAPLGIGLGNQGLQKSDPTNFAAGKPCSGGDWCTNFNTYHTPALPLELQTLSMTDPTNTSQTGSLTVLLPFATSRWANILELYVDDWMCTYDSSWNGNNTFSACTNAGYPAVVSAAATQIN